MAKVYIGTSGFYYSHWVGSFYPKNLSKEKYFSYYVKNFDTVEINSSFYHIPLEKTVNKWKENVSSNFVFTFKMSRVITHLKKLVPDKKVIDLFFKRLSSLAVTKERHLILLQTPSFLKRNPVILSTFLKSLPKTFLYAFEFRHQSWFSQEVYQILKKYNLSLVLSDSPRNSDGFRIWPYENIDTANFFYIRFHGSKDLYSSSYTDRELHYYASLIKEKMAKDQDVYCYFNNDAGGIAVYDAKRLKNLLRI